MASPAPLDMALNDAEDPYAVGFHAKSKEETYMNILGRSGANAKYQCPRCNHSFTGGNQKIRVHITGAKEGGSSVKACSDPEPEALAFCSLPRTPYKKRQKLEVDEEGNPILDEEGNPIQKKSKKEKKLEEVTDPNLEEAFGMLKNPLKQKEPDAPLVLLVEYGVEKAQDLRLLEMSHLKALAGALKHVPGKQFLDLMVLVQNPTA